MKPFIVCTFVTLLSGALAAPQDLTSKWEEFKAEHGKQYPSHEEAERMQRFAERHAEIEAHNARYAAGLESFSRQINHYSDLSDEELDKYAFGLSGVDEAPVFWNNSNVLPSLPVSFDWKEKGAMTPVKEQKDCGACYAFVAVALLESYLKRKTKKEYDLSEQDVIDCTYKQLQGGRNRGCDGGSPILTLLYLRQKGIALESSYPYTSGEDETHHTCRSDRVDSRLIDKRLKLGAVTVKDEVTLAELLVTKGPLIVIMSFSEKHTRMFNDLKDGIFDVPESSNDGRPHGVLLVGYGIENGKPFWSFKNSWGTKWGVGGYGKLARGKNMANILDWGARYVES